jgi:hypothetical protein
MTDSTAAIPPSPAPLDTPALQFAHATDHSKNAQSTAAAANAALLLQLALASANNASLTNDLLNLGNNQAIPTSDIIANEGLINLDTGTFLLLNNIVTNLGVTGVGGNLTARQIEASDIIQRDLLGLVGAFSADSLIQLGNEASTVDLSPQAKTIAGESVAATNATEASTTTLPTLTTTQLKQIAAILKPLANQPLTLPLLQQIQTQLAAAQLPPQLFNVATIFLVQNYMGKENQADDIESSNRELVTPVSGVNGTSAV